MPSNTEINNKFVTISVDDGHITDLRTAALLAKYSLAATFYIPARNSERPVMPEDEIRQLAKQFEIGAHTFNHVPLRSLQEQEAWSEIENGKKWLENLLGVDVPSFCYPQGKFDRQAAALVRKAGFLGGRTCFFNRNDFPADPFHWGVSTHAYSHGALVQIRHSLLELNLQGAWNFFTAFHGATDWENHFLYSLSEVDRYGGIAHLFLHSWEIENLGHWEKLERVFAAISERKNFKRVTNGDLFRLRAQNMHAVAQN
jgi:peptidoglycan/xylan/chitin deacetylase (PgdA/CDA1 family)